MITYNLNDNINNYSLNGIKKILELEIKKELKPYELENFKLENYLILNDYELMDTIEKLNDNGIRDIGRVFECVINGFETLTLNEFITKHDMIFRDSPIVYLNETLALYTDIYYIKIIKGITHITYAMF